MLRPIFVVFATICAVGCSTDTRVRGHDDSAAEVATAEGATIPDSLITALTRLLVPVDEQLASLPRVLRSDSGTIRADLQLVQQQKALDSAIDSVVRTFDDSLLQVTLWPDGARAQQRNRALGRSPTRQDTVAGDSLRSFLLAHGVWPYRAEGDTYFALNVGRLAKIADPFVTAAEREALQITAREQRDPLGGDAAVSIPWDLLGDRLSSAEAFLMTYPGAAARQQVADLQRRYSRAFLTGLDNTPVFDQHTGVLRPNVRASYERYLQQYASTPSATLIRDYLGILSATDYRRNKRVDEFLRTHEGIAQ